MQCIISKSDVKFMDSEVRTWRVENKLCLVLSVVICFICFKAMYNKIRFGFCDIRNNQGLG